MKALMVASFVLYGTVFCSSLLAEQVDDLYRGQVQVTNQTSMAQQAGVRDALRQVLVKLTGNSQILGTAKVDELLTHVDDYVAALGYTALSESAMSSNNANIGLDVNFSKAALDQFVRAQKLPVLPSNRPLLLIWMIGDDAQTGRRQFVNSLATPKIADLVAEKLQQRGIPFVFPGFDLEDRIALSEDEAWKMDASAIAEASQRYQSDVWLLLRFYTTSSGEVRGSWLYQASGERKLGDGRAANIEDFVPSSLDRIVDGIAGYYAYVPQARHNQFQVEVDGVTDYAGYRALKSQVEQLELVENLQMISVEGSKLALSVEVEGDIELLYQALLRSGYLRAARPVQAFDRGVLYLSWAAK